MLYLPLVATIAKSRPFVRPSLETALASLPWPRPRVRLRCARLTMRNHFDGQRAPSSRRWTGSLGRRIHRARHRPRRRRSDGLDAEVSRPERRRAISALPQPFVFDRTDQNLGPAPITIASATVEPLEAGAEIAVTVLPASPAFPSRSCCLLASSPPGRNLPGVTRLDHWTANYRAPTPDGLVFRASFRADRRQPSAASSASSPPLRDQPTAPSGSAVVAAGLAHRWTVDACWIVAPFALPIAPVPPRTLDYVAVTVFGVTPSRSRADHAPADQPSSTEKSCR